MPISSKGFIRATAALLLVGLLALLVIVGMTVWLSDRTQTYFNDVVEAIEARTAAVDLRFALQSAESGQRGYVITQDPAYLDPYNEAVGTVMPRLEKLDAVLAPYPQATEPMRKLRADVKTKLDEMARTVDLVKSGDIEGARALVNTDTGNTIMADARQFLGAVIAAADKRSSAGVADQRSNAIALRWATVFGAIVIFLVVGGSAWTVLRYTHELVDARSQLETVNERLEQRVNERTADLANANEEVQRFAYIVTHDLRAPLVNIMGFTAELETSIAAIKKFFEPRPESEDVEEQEARVAATEDLPEAVDFIRSSTRKMDGLINAILKISRDGRRPLKPETVRLSELLETATNSVHHQISETGGEAKIEKDLPTVVSDRLALEQIFGNLLDNAVKYADPDRPLNIEIAGRPTYGNRFIVDVTDTGRGIAPQDHERVFELFRRSGQQNKPGEGIGLAHVRTLVRNLGGDITLTSELGKGTTFHVSFARDLNSIVGTQDFMSTNGKPVTIVMIEDDEGHARLIEKNIRRAGVNNDILPFTDGNSALTYLFGSDGSGLDSAGRHMLVLLDLNLPDMSGVDILEKVKENQHTRRTPVVVLTTTDDEREIKRCYDLGANVYITKPVAYEGFANAIRQLGLFFSVMQVPETE